MPDNQLPSIERLASVEQSIVQVEIDAGRPAGDVTLVAVSKTFPVEEIRAVLDAGQRVFGENRVQEALGKWPELCEQYADVELHLIGPLQSNKVGEAVSLFDVIETLDREKLARALVAEEPALHFALLEKIAIRNGLCQLSMGMSADFETAIEFGATHVRVGSAIFGARTPA